jgi:hypothetical protein
MDKIRSMARHIIYNFYVNKNRCFLKYKLRDSYILIRVFFFMPWLNEGKIKKCFFKYHTPLFGVYIINMKDEITYHLICVVNFTL